MTAWPSKPEPRGRPDITGGVVADWLVSTLWGSRGEHDWRSFRIGPKWSLTINAARLESGSCRIRCRVYETGRSLSLADWEYRRITGRWNPKTLKALGYRVRRWAMSIRVIRESQLAAESEINRRLPHAEDRESFAERVESIGLPVIYDDMSPAQVTKILGLIQR